MRSQLCQGHIIGKRALAGVVLIMALARGVDATTYTWNGPVSGGTWDQSNNNWDTSQVDPWDAADGPTNVAYFAAATTNSISGTIYLNGVVLNAASKLGVNDEVYDVYFVGAAPTVLLDSGHEGGSARSQFGFAEYRNRGHGANGITIQSAGGTARNIDWRGNNTNLLGGLTVGAGVSIRIFNVVALGGGDVTLNSATLSFAKGGYTLANDFSVNGGTLYFDLDGNTGTLNGNIDMAGNLTFSGGRISPVLINGVISNSASGNLTISLPNNGGVTLTAANTYSGMTTVSDGYLVLKNENAMQNSTLGGNPNNKVMFDSSVASKVFVLGGLAAASGELVLTNTAGDAVTLLVGNNDSSSTTGVEVAGSGSLVKIGTGTLTLTNANTYAGATAVSNGILEITAAGSIASTNWAIASGATLRLNTAVDLGGKSVEIAAGGSAAGLLDVVGNLTLGGSLSVTTYTEPRIIAQCSGTISGTFASQSLPSGCYLVIVDDTQVWIKRPSGTVIVVN